MPEGHFSRLHKDVMYLKETMIQVSIEYRTMSRGLPMLKSRREFVSFTSGIRSLLQTPVSWQMPDP